MHRRTALITAASIAAVVLTGATAVGANIGILSNASASDVGELTAVAAIAQSDPLPDPSATVLSTPTADDSLQLTIQSFEADAAGVVEVQFGSGQLRLGSVDPAAGWTWSSAQTSDAQLGVSFVSEAGDTLEFVAELLPDGTLSARVDEMIVEMIQGQPEVITVHQQAATPTGGSAIAEPSPTSAPVTTPARTSPPDAFPAPTAQPAAPFAPAATTTSVAFDDDGYDDDDRDDGGYDDDDRDDGGYDDDDRDDGGYDDDDHEYEGADDDD